MAHSRQKSYADKRKMDLEFMVDELFYLNISPFRGVMRFGKKMRVTKKERGNLRHGPTNHT